MIAPRQTASAALAAAPSAAALVAAAFLVLPLLGLVGRAPWSRAAEVLGSPAARDALWLSLVVATAAATAALALGLPLAWVLARDALPGATLLRALALLPVVLPPVVGGVGLLAALGRRGIAGPLLGALGIALPFTTAGAVVAATYVCLPMVVLAAEAGLRGRDARLEAAARTLGASPWYAARRVTLPLVGPQLAAGAALAWARALGEFGATITFAGNLRGRTQTLPLAVYELQQSDPDAALLVALLQVVVAVAVLVAARRRFLLAR